MLEPLVQVEQAWGLCLVSPIRPVRPGSGARVARLRAVIEAKDTDLAALRAAVSGLRADLEAERERLPLARRPCSCWPHELVATAQGRAQVGLQLTEPEQVQNRSPDCRRITVAQGAGQLAERPAFHIGVTYPVEQGGVE